MNSITKKFFLIISVVVSIAIIVVSVFYCFNTKKKKGIYKDNWAIFNYGQCINGSTGVDGIDINFQNVLNNYNSQSDVVIGVVDTGVEYYSDTLKTSIWQNNIEIPNNQLDDDKNGYIDDVFGWDFYNQDASVFDGHLYDYHGTYISNIINFIAPNAILLSSKFLKGTQGDATDAVAAILYAIDNGAKIINCSWCFENEEQDLLDVIISNPDVLFVCAAGNSGLNLDKKSVYPASYSFDNLITVMSIDNTGNRYELSGYGNTVDIAAPGKDVLVTILDGDLTYVSGTSVSVAFVTGTAALLKSYNPQLTASDIKNIITKSAKKIDTLKGLCKSEGILDVKNAVNICRKGEDS